VENLPKIEPCTYCGHPECGGWRPYDSAHLPRYCMACWNDSQLAQQTVTLEKQTDAMVEANRLQAIALSEGRLYEPPPPPKPQYRPDPAPQPKLPKIVRTA
jgi:hypothetical protein